MLGVGGVGRAGETRARTLWWVALAAGLLLRLWFLAHPMPFDDDTDVYADLATNLFHHGVYGITDGDLTAGGSIDPTLIRLPGYPIFLGFVFAVFGAGNMRAVLLAQIAIDLLACWLIASFVREQLSERAGTIAIFIAALCPFTAAYSATALTECLSIFAVSLTLWATGRVLRAQADAAANDRTAPLFAACGMALAVLLRPDGVLLSMAVVAAVLWYGLRQGTLRPAIKTAAFCALLAALPLAPWAARNWSTFHVIQPLAPRRVNDPGEYVTYGFYRWMSTWSVDVVSTGNVFWRVGTEAIDVNDLPARAFDSPSQRAQTAQLLAEYNATKTVTPELDASFTITPELDAKFGALAAERVREHPLLCRVWVPGLKVADMWLRPRTETLGLDADWWRFDEHRVESMEAVGLGLVNLALMVVAIVGVMRGRVPWVAFAVAYIALRCLLLSTMENSEPRYTLEAFPMVIACAACAFGGMRAAKPLPMIAPAEEIAT